MCCWSIALAGQAIRVPLVVLGSAAVIGGWRGVVGVADAGYRAGLLPAMRRERGRPVRGVLNDGLVSWDSGLVSTDR